MSSPPRTTARMGSPRRYGPGTSPARIVSQLRWRRARFGSTPTISTTRRCPSAALGNPDGGARWAARCSTTTPRQKPSVSSSEPRGPRHVIGRLERHSAPNPQPHDRVIFRPVGPRVRREPGGRRSYDQAQPARTSGTSASPNFAEVGGMGETLDGGLAAEATHLEAGVAK